MATPDNESLDTEDESLDIEDEIENERLEQYYNKFYKTPSNTITLFFIYVDNNNVESLHEKSFHLNNDSKICSDELVFIINNHKTLHNKRYKLMTLLKYNFTMDPEEVLQMLSNSNEKNEFEKYLDVIGSYLVDVCFADTISLLEDVNALFLVYSRQTIDANNDKLERRRKNTKRVKFCDDSSKKQKTRKQI